MDQWATVGLGLDNSCVALGRTTRDWLTAGAELCDAVTALLCAGGRVEQIGSSSVLGLLAKPIIDLAIGLVGSDDFDEIVEALRADGWIYRGDAGDRGGEVFVLEISPGRRIAHLHAVELNGRQWSNYLRLRDLLRSSGRARDTYESAKLSLAEQYPTDREAYTNGKTGVVASLLAESK